MGFLTPQLSWELDTLISKITTQGYETLAANTWWQRFSSQRTTTFHTDLLNFFLATFVIRDEQQEGGLKHYEDLVMKTTTIEHRHAGGGVKINNDRLLDTDGNGWDLAAEWARQSGPYMAYWPQKQVTRFMKNAHSLATAGGFTAYDGKAFFAKDHPNLPGKTARGTYANLFSGSAVASSTGTPAYPGLILLDGVTDDVALTNLTKVFTYIASIFLPNGEDPRRLRISEIGAGPVQWLRITKLLSASFLASAASTGGGATDVAGYLKKLKLPEPVLIEELAGFESDQTFFVKVESSNDQLGGCIYTERESFRINYYGVQTQPELNRRNESEYQIDGRNSVSAGHPYDLFKVMQT